MKIAIIGQQDFGKAVLEAFPGPRRRCRCCILRAREGRREARCTARRRAGEGSQGSSVQIAAGSGSRARHAGRRRRHRHHGVRPAIRAAGIRDHSEARHDSISSVAAAEVPRPELHQLADHQGRNGNRADHLPPVRRARRRRSSSPEEDADQPRRHARHHLLRSPVPDGCRRPCSKPRTSCSQANIPRPCRTNRKRVTKAGAARPKQRSTGPNPSITSTT